MMLYQQPGLAEDYRFVTVHNDPVFQVPAHGAGEHSTFDVPAKAFQVFHSVPVGNGDYVLFDDRPCVQFRSHIVRCGADPLDATFIGLAVGICPRESRKE